MGRLYIPEMFEEEVTFEQASFHFTHWRKGDDLLEKLTEFQDFYDLTIRKIEGNVHDRYDWDCDFFEEWRWEICYFNCLFAGFSELSAVLVAATVFALAQNHHLTHLLFVFCVYFSPCNVFWMKQ